jgi:Lon-like protease
VRRILWGLAPGLVFALCLYLVPLPLFVATPGPAEDVLPLIDVDGAPTYQPDGRLLFTTVNLPRVNAYDAIWGWWDPVFQVLPERAVIPPGQTDREYEQVSLSQMDESKIAAVVVALDRLTDYPREHGVGALVRAVERGSPADDRLFPGDLITEANGRPVEDVAALSEAILRTGTGGTVTLSVEPVEGEGDARVVRLRPVLDPRQDRPVIGVYLVANFPFEVFIDSGRIGGPSAGLMWTLGLIDLLSPGDLTDGRVLAGTGEIAEDGRVGGIGGIGLKILAARDAGAEAFLLPRANVAEARGVDADIELVPVGTVDEALRYLGGP